MSFIVALKVDVDTERGTREGVPALAALLDEFAVPASFLFSLGPDNTGKAIRRIFRPGFFQKVSRTGVVQMYGIRTLLNGTLRPAPHIGSRHADVMRRVRDAGFETGIHCHDHYQWQDHLFRMSLAEVRNEFARARTEYHRIFGCEAATAGAPGWQANANSRQVYDEAALLYASDTRGDSAFFPVIDARVFKTLEIPSTLPTFDELLGRPAYPEPRLVSHYVGLLVPARPNVMTLHAEIEGMAKRPLFRRLLAAWSDHGVRFIRMDDLARELLAHRATIPVRPLVMAEIDGRSGTVATQGRAADPHPKT
ncbi:MAG: polysaccharide deacetylase family protein [Verrucomicrobia bacterium]|nr:polysaccharide deacetylase family protein [Verrucomicrobiota bacterium]